VTRAKRVLKVRTETEAIVQSLEEVPFINEVERAIRATVGRLPQYRALE
jgi:hypothetical protein